MVEIIAILLIIIFFPFLFIGVINRVKSVWAGRQGPSLWQPFYDFARLLKKSEVVGNPTSFIFRIAPSINLAAVLSAGLVIPLIGYRSIMGFDGDMIFFIYILGLGKFFNILAALDTGSSFEGMGASREATFSIFVEPAFFLLLGTLCFISGYTRFDQLFVFLSNKAEMAPLVKGLGSLVVFLMVLVEGCRVPVDDPNTHLELTMIHEVMILDNSGPDLALIQYAAAAKMVIFSSLVPCLVMPAGLSFPLRLLLYCAIIFILAILIGLVESLSARLRMIHVPQFIVLMTAVVVVVLSALIISSYGGM